MSLNGRNYFNIEEEEYERTKTHTTESISF